jgi:hypothetical protein
MAYIASFTTVKPELAHTKTYEDFYKFLGYLVAPLSSNI